MPRSCGSATAALTPSWIPVGTSCAPPAAPPARPGFGVVDAAGFVRAGTHSCDSAGTLTESLPFEKTIRFVSSNQERNPIHYYVNVFCFSGRCALVMLR